MGVLNSPQLPIRGLGNSLSSLEPPWTCEDINMSLAPKRCLLTTNEPPEVLEPPKIYAMGDEITVIRPTEEVDIDRNEIFGPSPYLHHLQHLTNRIYHQLLDEHSAEKNKELSACDQASCWIYDA